MDDKAGSCAKATKASESTACLQPDAVETLNHGPNHQNLVLPDAHPSVCASVALNGDGPRLIGTQELSLGRDQSSTGSSVRPSTEAEEHECKDDQVLDLEPRTDGSRLGFKRIAGFIQRLRQPMQSPNLRLPRSIFSNATENTSNNPFRFIIDIERLPRQGGSGLQSATLSLDTGSDYNLISLELADSLYPERNFRSATPHYLAMTPGGPMYSVGTVSARWSINHEKSPPSGNFPQKFVSTKFDVSDRLAVNVILGRHDIQKHELLSAHPRPGSVGFIGQNPPVDRRNAARIEADADLRREEEARLMRANPHPPTQQSQQQRDAYARERAQAYADQHHQPRSDGWWQAYRQVYDQLYPTQHAS